MSLSPEQTTIWNELSGSIPEVDYLDAPVTVIMGCIPYNPADIQEAVLYNRDRGYLDEEGYQRALDYMTWLFTKEDFRSIIAELPIEKRGDRGFTITLLCPAPEPGVLSDE